MPRRISVFHIDGRRVDAHESRLHAPPNFNWKHELRILLQNSRPDSNWQFSNDESSSGNTFLGSIRDAVAAFKDEIDVVSMKGEPFGPELWMALNGLNPVHLELTEGPPPSPVITATSNTSHRPGNLSKVCISERTAAKEASLNHTRFQSIPLLLATNTGPQLSGVS